MDTFDHLLNWKLKVGSHRFPGPDGGTCINEAALVAAGFPYRPILHPEQMPACFSRPICSLAMLLNDFADDAQRQRLLPLVTRLACADTPEIEKERATYIGQHLRCRYFSGVMLGVMTVSFEVGLEVLEGALSIGRQADPLGPDEVQTWMSAARYKAGTLAIGSGSPFFSKIKSWLTMKETEPAA